MVGQRVLGASIRVRVLVLEPISQDARVVMGGTANLVHAGSNPAPVSKGV